MGKIMALLKSSEVVPGRNPINVVFELLLCQDLNLGK